MPCNETTLLFITLAITFLFSGAAGAMKLALSEKILSARYYVATAIIHGSSGVSAAAFVGGITIYVGKDALDWIGISLMIGSGLIVSKIGNDKMVRLVLGIARKLTGLPEIEKDENKVIARFMDKLNPEQIERALSEFLQRQQEIAEYLKSRDEDSQTNRLQKLLASGEFTLAEINAMRKKKEGSV
jgi:hypothetical protein